MKLTKGFWQTYKEVPADAEIPSHQLMIRAGLIHKSGSGLYNYLPMGLRSIRKVENIIREELNKIGCNEIAMSVVTPGELWQETGRWDKMGGLMLRFKDKKDADLCISPTNEEAVTDIFRKTVKSYKQLPVGLYQINTKFRDEIRPRFGLMRGREFTMKDAYTFHMDKASLDQGYQEMYDAYTAIFTRLGLEFIPVVADGGAMASADSKTHEFQVVANSGEDLIIYSQEAQYAANVEKAQTLRSKTNFDLNIVPLKEVETIKTESIEAVCKLLNITQAQSLKSMVYTATTKDESKLVLAMVIGDDTVNEVKLQNYLKCDHLVATTEDEMKKAKLWKGFIGPVNLDSLLSLEIILDSEINLDASYVIGANKKDAHLIGFNPKRDLKKIVSADLRLSKAGDLTLDGQNTVVEKRGIEVGHVFQLGDKYTKDMKVGILDQNGKLVTPLMGCYGIGVTRVVAAAIEQNHDENGIVWPKSIAPYQVYFATIVKAEEFVKIADDIYKDMMNAGLEVIYDDRNVGPGNKFKDSDLLGLPYRVVLGERDFGASGELEVIERKTGLVTKVKREDLIQTLNNFLK
ncbi:MAG: proline--tRNA ligase [Bacteriovoracaceae bacterium]|nr:proline--tRNA ligase [Bacteriovoracaceae bacterium]